MIEAAVTSQYDPPLKIREVLINDSLIIKISWVSPH